VLLSAFGWRSIFLVTVPFAILGAALGWLIVPRTTALAKDRRFDIGGAILVVPALAAAMLTITEAQAWGLSAPLLVSAAAAASLLGAFVWRENRAPAPLIDLKLFRTANFSAGAVGVLVSYSMLYGMFFAISFAFVRGYHEQFFAAGLRLTIVPVALALVAPFGGAASDKHPRLVMLAGMILSALSALALTRLLTGGPASLPGVMISLATFGVGLGLYIASDNNAAMTAAPAAESGEAGGLLNLLRVLGTGVGVASASAVLGFRLGGAGVAVRTAGTPDTVMLAAVGDTLVMVAAFGALDALMAIIRHEGPPPPPIVPRSGAQSRPGLDRELRRPN
jgi:hypothetical protein